MDVRSMQTWLNAHGANIPVDGLGGPSTRSAILQVFTNKKAPAISDVELRSIAAYLGDPNGIRLKKVAKVEAAGSGWFNSGLVKILYERHIFYRRTSGKFGITELSNSKAGGYTIDANNDDIIDSWEKLAKAACLDPLAAFESVSIGKFQVMGFHANKLGYSNALEMMWAASQSEAAQYEMCARYINKFDLRDEFLKISNDPADCVAFAKGYNGAGYAKFSYHVKLARA
jgi:N-acetylmuramidase